MKVKRGLRMLQFRQSGMVDSVPTRLRKLLKRSGLSLQELARGAGYKGASSIQRYFSEAEYGKDFLTPDVAHVFATAMEGLGSPPVTKAEVLELAGIKSEPFVIPLEPAPQTGAWPMDVPILGTTVGGAEADFEINRGETIGHVRRPPWLTRKIFSLYVQGNSMARWREPGTLVYLDPARPPKAGDRVVVELLPEDEGGGHPAFLKELVAQTPTKLRLRQYNPEGTIELPLSKVVHVYRVIEWDELLAV